MSVIKFNFRLLAGHRKICWVGKDKDKKSRECSCEKITFIAVGSVVNLLIHPVGAIIIGCLAGALSVVGYRYLSVKLFFNYFFILLVPPQTVAINFIFPLS